MQSFEQSRRSRVGGGRNGCLGLVVLLGAGLLVLMVSIGTIDAPPPATPLPVAPGPSPAASPTPAPWAAEFLYLVRQRPSTPAAGAQRFLEVIDSSSGRLVYTLADVADAALSADGRTLFALGAAEVVALDAATAVERWRSPLGRPLEYAIESAAGSRLTLSADGATVLVLRQQLDGRLGRQLAWIERYASHNGAALGQPVAVDPVAWNPTLIAGGPGTALLASPTGLAVIDLATGLATPLMDRESGPFVAALAPRQHQIYVANGDSVLNRMSRFDPTRDRRSALLSAALRPSFGPDTLAVAPDGGLVALVIERPGPPVIRAGMLTNGPVIELAVIESSTGTILRQAELPADSWISHLAFSADGTLVYFMDNSRLSRWHLESNTVGVVAQLSNGLDRLLVGPALRTLPPAPTPTPAAEATPTPRPLPPPLTRSGAETVAWLWPVDGPDAAWNVAAYAADGSARLVAERIDAVVARPGQMPLLLRESGQREWQIVDPAAQITATVRFDAPPRPLFYANSPFLPSPDGGSLAFVSNSDLIATDALTDISQLVLIDVRSGALRALAGLDRLEEQVDWQTAQWTARGITVFGRTPAAATIRAVNALWRIDPAAKQPALERLLGFEQPGAYASLNAAAGLVLYQPHTDDPRAASLRLVALEGGAETAVMERGPFIDIYEAMISPDGRYVAYLRPTADLDTFDLVLYSVAEGRERLLLGGQSRYGLGGLAWSGQHRLHLLRYDQQPWLGVVADDVWALGDLVPTRPQRQFSPAYRWRGAFGGDPGWLDRRRFAHLDTLGGYALLRRISLDPSPSVDVALPLSAEPGPNAPVLGETAVIYEP